MTVLLVRVRVPELRKPPPSEPAELPETVLLARVTAPRRSSRRRRKCAAELPETVLLVRVRVPGSCTAAAVVTGGIARDGAVGEGRRANIAYAAGVAPGISRYGAVGEGQGADAEHATAVEPAEFPDTVLSVSVKVPELKMPPPETKYAEIEVLTPPVTVVSCRLRSPVDATARMRKPGPSDRARWCCRCRR